MADYTHSKGVSTTDNGYAVGAAGSETTVITQTASVVLGGTTIATTNRVQKIAKVALGVADTAGGVLSWANPETGSIIITRVVLDVTTKSTGACTLDVGTTAVSATTTSDTLIDGVDVGTEAGTFDNYEDAGTNGTSRQKLATGKWVTASKASGAAAGLAGYAYIEYFLI